MDFLYPDIEPFNESYVTVSDLHTVHFEQCGNPAGQPVLFLHGGPGGGIDPLYRRFFNPDHYHVILVNQRGSGKSTPFAETQQNNTQALIEDFEKIREQLSLKQWMVFGGSWGSTLALAYAQAHPHAVTQLILRGIYLGSDAENQWLFGGQGANRIFPELWQPFLGLIPEDERHDMIAAYYTRLINPDKAVHLPAAKAWSAWEVGISKLEHDAAAVTEYINSPACLSLSRFESHYMHNRCFLEPNQLINNMDKIQHIPGIIVHGRYDVICAAASAWKLHQAWENSTLHYVSQAGHSLADPQLAKKLLTCMDDLIR
jgi:proline iminopeptidase